MKTFRRTVISLAIPVSMLFLVAGNARCQNAVLTAILSNPTNNQAFTAPANIYVHARMVDTNLIRSVAYFSGTTNIGTVTNLPGLLETNLTQGNPFPIIWSNVMAGAYSLTAVVMDSAGNTATSAPVNITVTNPIVRPAVYIYSPANGTTYLAPTNVNIYARAVEGAGTVVSVQFFANSINLGVVSNSSQVIVPSISSALLFPLTWSNPPPGSYGLRAIATDASGNMATSSVVNISIVTNLPPPPNVPFTVGFWYPTNGQSFLAPANVGVHALVTDSNVVRTMQYFANGSSIGIITNTGNVLFTNSTQGNPFFFAWKNVLAGNYALTAVATDSAGNNATSAPVNIIVTNPPPPPNIPFAVGFWYPTNGQMFLAPANIGVHARVTDSNVVQTVQYFANGTSIGTVTNTGGVLLTNATQANSFFLDWSNVPAGSYALTAVATDSAGNNATSAPVNILVLTTLPPVIKIYAPDPVGIEGTNYISWYYPASTASNYVSGANTATFLVHRDGETNNDLTVHYSIGGTAINGVDYETIPGSVVIPAGRSYALITIVPLDDNDSSYRDYDSVILTLLAPPTAFGSPATYSIGSPSSAGAVILEENVLPIPRPLINSLADSSLHVSLPATNGMNFCLQISTDMANWLPVCTNTVLKGSAQFVDPHGTASPGLYYRIVPVDTPATY